MQEPPKRMLYPSKAVTNILPMKSHACDMLSARKMIILITITTKVNTSCKVSLMFGNNRPCATVYWYFVLTPRIVYSDNSTAWNRPQHT